MLGNHEVCKEVRSEAQLRCTTASAYNWFHSQSLAGSKKQMKENLKMAINEFINHPSMGSVACWVPESQAEVILQLQFKEPSE